MALSDVKKATAYDLGKGEKKYDNTTDVFKYVIITEGFSSIDEDATSIGIANYTKVVSAGAYVQDVTIANTTWTQTGNISALKGDSFNFAADPSNPVTGKTIAIYNDTSATKDVVVFVDLTTDGGTTPADTTLGLNYTVNANGIATTTTNA